ncbi:7922_t:CDS:10 [Acaulospora morrowiae]|uniref:7922_t:CDS:1 n=1 Tax=Acaulospora morrowiae TaxID=94023 RepID=A0A9N9DKZ8_9GLOM|nr:7922_t:CDS:10 [Acaulospora morrowiae]
MTLRLPFTKLLHHPSKNILILVFGAHFQALDTSTGSFIVSTRALSSELSTPILKYISPADAHAAPIRAISFCDKIQKGVGSLLATSCEDKLLKIWNIDSGWDLKSTRPVAKRAVSIAFDALASRVITADKFGDVLSYPLELPDNECTYDLLLGHVSMVTDMVLSHNNKYVITADRDEHIRVSRYPKGYEIESYCLGHTQFLSKLHILPWDTNLLLSAGGDDFIALWDYVPGTLIQELNIKKLIESQMNDETIENSDIASDDTEYLSKAIAVSSLVCCKVLQHIAVIIEKFPGVIILRWDYEQRCITYKQTLTLCNNPLDISYDLRGNLWVASSAEELVTIFLRRGDEYVKASVDHPLVHQINTFGSMTVDALPDLYTIGQLRKEPTDWRELKKDEQEDKDDDSSQSVDSLEKSPKKKKAKHVDDRKNKRIKSE